MEFVTLQHVAILAGGEGEHFICESISLCENMIIFMRFARSVALHNTYIQKYLPFGSFHWLMSEMIIF